MRIAVIEHAEAGDYADYISSLINEKATENNYQLKSWSNSVPAFQQQVASDAIIYIYIESTSPVLLSWLYNVKIPSILKKTKAQSVIDLNGIASSKIKIPQTIIAAEHFFTDDKKQLNSVEKFAAKHLNNSSKIATHIFSYTNKKLNVDANENKVQPILFSAPHVFKTYEWHEKLMVKSHHADNKEFFIAVIEDDNVDDFVLLLQAFSKFKKWQQSTMQLLVLPKYESLGGAIREKHQTYKYREDVRLIEAIEESKIAAIFASAYALIHVATNKPHLLVLSIAMQCSLPIISFKHEDVNEYANGVVLLYEEKNAEAIGNAIIRLYKDENLHAQLKEKAQQQSVFLNREECEKKLWSLLTDAAHS
ncbi:MAG: glycosyltransferase [Parafilimonas sp.]|nr:glycosyltransferase [Parafilimonas sp.]